MLTCLVPVLFTFYIQGVLKLKKNNSGAKGLRKLLRIKPWVQHDCTSGLVVSKEMKCLLKTHRIVASLPQAELTKNVEKVLQAALAEGHLDHWWNLTNNRCVTEFIRTHFYGIFDDETGCCKIRATSAHRGAKTKHVNVCCDLQEELKNDARFLTKAVTGDESWWYGYDPESKQQSTSGSRQIHPGGEKKMASLL